MNLEMRRQPVLPVDLNYEPHPWRWGIGAIGLLILIVLLVWFADFARDPERSAVTRVDVLGTVDFADRDAISSTTRDFLADGFFLLDIDGLRRALEARPWVAKAHIRRSYPERVILDVEEREPAARFNDDSLISKRLVLFKPPQLQPGNARSTEWQDFFASLPALRGAPGRHEAVLGAYRRYEQQLKPFGVGIESLDEDDRGAQTLMLANGITVRLGIEDRELRMQRFMDVYERLVPLQQHDAMSFDMRYSNGFALSGAVAGS